MYQIINPNGRYNAWTLFKSNLLKKRIFKWSKLILIDPN